MLPKVSSYFATSCLKCCLVFRLIDSSSKGSDQKFLAIVPNLKPSDVPSDRKFFNSVKLKNVKIQSITVLTFDLD
jgi:hypothetical protein